MFETAVATVGLKPVVCAASDTGPEVFPPQRRLGAVLPVARLDDGELAARLRRVVALEAELAAYKTELVVALAGRRPDSLDVPDGRVRRRPPGRPGRSRWPVGCRSSSATSWR